MMISNTPTHILAAILASSRQSKRQARALCNAAGLGGGSGDLAKVLAYIESDHRRESIHAAAADAARGPGPVLEHEEWIVGQGVSGRMYVVHTLAPRFVGEIFSDNDAPLSGVSMVLDDEVCANIDWIDPIPPEAELHALRASIQDFLDEADAAGEEEVGEEEPE